MEDDTTSRSPSPSRSAIATHSVFRSVVNGLPVRAVKEPPPALRIRCTLPVLALPSATARSATVSPSRSPMAMPLAAAVSVVVSVALVHEAPVPPLVSTRTEPAARSSEPASLTARSCGAVPLSSPAAIPVGDVAPVSTCVASSEKLPLPLLANTNTALPLASELFAAVSTARSAPALALNSPATIATTRVLAVPKATAVWVKLVPLRTPTTSEGPLAVVPAAAKSAELSPLSSAASTAVGAMLPVRARRVTAGNSGMPCTALPSTLVPPGIDTELPVTVG